MKKRDSLGEAEAFDNRRAPGPPTQRWRPQGSALIVYTAILLATALVIHAYFVQNPASYTPPAEYPWKLKLLDLDQAVSLLLALLGVAVVRTQYARAHRPYLTYEGLNDQPARLLSADNESAKVRKVTLRNVGPGMALLHSPRYRVAEPAQSVMKSYPLDHATLVAHLETLKLREGTDYSIASFSDGAAIGPGLELVLFEGKDSVRATLKALDVRVTCSGVLGDQYVKDVFLLGGR